MRNKLDNATMADLLAYCSRLASMVSPRDALNYYGFTFDGAVGDTLRGLAQLYATDGNIADFMEDELYGPTLKQMLADINRLLEDGV